MRAATACQTFLNNCRKLNLWGCWQLSHCVQATSLDMEVFARAGLWSSCVSLYSFFLFRGLLSSHFSFPKRGKTMAGMSHSLCWVVKCIFSEFSRLYLRVSIVSNLILFTPFFSFISLQAFWNLIFHCFISFLPAPLWWEYWLASSVRRGEGIQYVQEEDAQV